MCLCVCVLQATKVSADGEQVEDDADRIHKRAEDLEQFIRDTLLGAQGKRSEHQHHLPSINFLHFLPTGISGFICRRSHQFHLSLEYIASYYIVLNVVDPCGKFGLLH